MGISTKPDRVAGQFHTTRTSLLGWLFPGRLGRCGGTWLRPAGCHESTGQYPACGQRTCNPSPGRRGARGDPNDRMDAGPRQSVQPAVLAISANHRKSLRVRLEKIHGKADSHASQTRRVANGIRRLFNPQSQRRDFARRKIAENFNQRLMTPSRHAPST